MNMNLCEFTLTPLAFNQHNTSVTTQYIPRINNSIPQSIYIT